MVSRLRDKIEIVGIPETVDQLQWIIAAVARPDLLGSQNLSNVAYLIKTFNGWWGGLERGALRAGME